MPKRTLKELKQRVYDLTFEIFTADQYEGLENYVARCELELESVHQEMDAYACPE
jgi:reverse gyrase